MEITYLKYAIILLIIGFAMVVFDKYMSILWIVGVGLMFIGLVLLGLVFLSGRDLGNLGRQ